RSSVIWRYSGFVRRTSLWRWWSLKVRGWFIARASFSHGCRFRADTVTDFSWEPKGERFAIVSSNDPNLGNPGPGITVKTDVSFYQLDRGKNDFKLLRI